jgi:large subunit ribosomal protein L20
MPRATFGVARHQRKKKVMKRARGMVLARSSQYKAAKESVRRADRFAHRDRRTRKRVFRALWITRISAGCKALGINYSRFINGLLKAEVKVNRKMLSELAIHDPAAFGALVDEAKAALTA